MVPGPAGVPAGCGRSELGAAGSLPEVAAAALSASGTRGHGLGTGRAVAHPGARALSRPRGGTEGAARLLRLCVDPRVNPRAGVLDTPRVGGTVSVPAHSVEWLVHCVLRKVALRGPSHAGIPDIPETFSVPPSFPFDVTVRCV